MNLPLNSFNGGEVSPYIDGRSDVKKYASSCRRLENMIPLVYGGVERRPGTKYIGTAKNSPQTVRLIPFIYSSEIAYMCEFGNKYIRFYYDDALLTDGDAVEVVTPYPEGDLNALQGKQIGDEKRIVHPNHAPRKLSRTTATTFTLEAITFTTGPFLTRNDISNDDDVTLASDWLPDRRTQRGIVDGLCSDVRERPCRVDLETHPTPRGYGYESVCGRRR